MKICVISKYPPIHGAVSAVTYWRVKRLGELGHEIHLVTNAWEVEEEHRQENVEKDMANFIPKNVHLYSTDPKEKLGYKYIPYTRPDIAKIASLAIDVVRKYDLPLIDSWYMLPYCISGFICKKVTNKPLIVRHAGSDITWLIESPFLRTLFIEVFKNADKIATNSAGKEKLISFGISPDKLFPNTTSVNTDAFNPKVKPIDLSNYTDKNIDGLPILTCVGKIHEYKGAFELVKAAAKLKEDFRLLFVAGGTKLKELKNLVKSCNLEEKTIFMKLQPPWKMPSIFAASTCVITAEYGWPMPAHTPYAAHEAMASGRCAIISKETFAKGPFNKLEDGINTIVVDPSNSEQFAEKLNGIIKNPDYVLEIGKNAREFSEKIERFESEIFELTQIYNYLL